jgi:hypothetical protein
MTGLLLSCLLEELLAYCELSFKDQYITSMCRIYWLKEEQGLVSDTSIWTYGGMDTIRAKEK